MNFIVVVLLLSIFFMFTFSIEISLLVSDYTRMINETAIEASRLYDTKCDGSSYYATHCASCSYFDGGNQFPDSLTCSQGLGPIPFGEGYCELQGGNLDYDKSYVRVQIDTDPTDLSNVEDICLTKNMDQVFKAHLAYTTQKQYFGSDRGVTRMYPGKPRDRTGAALTENLDASKQNKLSAAYDPRLRPWYVAAASGPKDIILVLDISGSMSNTVTDPFDQTTAETRISILKKAASAIIGTLGANDYVNVVTFADSANQLVEGAPLVRADDPTKLRLISKINALQPTSGTNYKSAFALAFDIFTKSSGQSPNTDYETNGSPGSSNCNKIMIFLTDGEPNAGKDVNDTDISQSQKQLPADNKVTIFTFSMGNLNPTAQDRLKKIACNNRGVYQPVTTSRDTISSMSGYYRLLATIVNAHERTVWTYPYIDFVDKTMKTTIAKPVYGSDGVFFGVVALDLPIKLLQDSGASYREIFNYLVSASSNCVYMPTGIEADCQLQMLRNVIGNQECPTDPEYYDSSLLSNNITAWSTSSSTNCSNFTNHSVRKQCASKKFLTEIGSHGICSIANLPTTNFTGKFCEMSCCEGKCVLEAEPTPKKEFPLWALAPIISGAGLCAVVFALFKRNKDRRRRLQPQVVPAAAAPNHNPRFVV